MKNFTENRVSQNINVVAPTPGCDTVAPCTQSGCVSGMALGNATDVFAGFAAPVQQKNDVQTFQAAPCFLC